MENKMIQHRIFAVENVWKMIRELIQRSLIRRINMNGIGAQQLKVGF